MTGCSPSLHPYGLLGTVYNSCSKQYYKMQFEASSHLLRSSLLDVRLSGDPAGGDHRSYHHNRRSKAGDSGHHQSLWGSPGFLKRGLRRWGSTGSWVGDNAIGPLCANGHIKAICRFVLFVIV